MKSKYQHSKSQITLDVEGIDANGNYFKTTIVVDELSYNPKTNKYIITEAKHSISKDLTVEKQLEGTFTDNQKIAYEAIGNGKATSVTPRGGNAENIDLSPSKPINVESTINIGVNNSNGGITYRTYP